MTTYWEPCATATYVAGGLSGLTAAFANEPRLPRGIKQANSTSADEMTAKLIVSCTTTLPVGLNPEPTINIAVKYTAYTTTRRIGKHKHVCEYDQCAHTVSITMHGKKHAHAFQECVPRLSPTPSCKSGEVRARLRVTSLCLCSRRRLRVSKHECALCHGCVRGTPSLQRMAEPIQRYWTGLNIVVAANQEPTRT